MSGNDVCKEMQLWLEGIAQIDENTAYASCSEFNALFKVDLKTGDCTYVALFPDEKLNAKRLFIKAVFVNGKIYFIPASASAISVYDVETGTFESIIIRDDFVNEKYSRKYKFADAFIYRDTICILPATYPTVVKLNYKENTLEYFSKNMPETEYLFRPGTAQIGNKLYVPNTKDNLVLEFDMETNDIRKHYVGKNNHGSWSMVADGDYLWLIPQRHGAIVKWNYKNGDVFEYDVYPDGYVESDFCFTKGYKSGEHIYVLPAKANMFIKVKLTGVMEENNLLQLQNHEMVTYMFHLGDYEYFYKSSKESVQKSFIYYRLNRCNNFIEEWGFRFCNKREIYANVYFIKRANLVNGIPKYRETEFGNVGLFLKAITKSLSVDKEIEKTNIKIGEKIYTGIL